MCGIAGVFLRDPDFDVDMDALLTTLLDKIEFRGRDACGFVALTNEGVGQWQKAAVDATKFNRYRQFVPRGTRVMLGHTRLATQGDPGFMENNHPIKRGPFYIVHNGHVSNDVHLFTKAERDRYGSVDSEAIAARLAYEGDLDALDIVMSEIEGAAAVAAVDERDCSRLVVARASTSPVWVYNGKRIVIFASTKWAVESTHKQHIGGVAADRLVEMDEGDMFIWNGDEAKTKTFEVKKRQVTTTYTYVPSPWAINKNAKATTKTSGGQKALPAAGKTSKPLTIVPSEDMGWDDDFVHCENCNVKVPWMDVNYFRIPGEAMQFLTCDACFEELAAEIEEEEILLEGDGFTVNLADEEEIIDDYERANRNILTNFLRGFL